MKALITLLLLGMVILAGCSSQQEPTTTPPAAAPETSAPSPMPIVPEAGEEPVQETEVVETTPEEDAQSAVPVKEIDVIAKQWEFVPETITVNQGDKVILHLKSEDVTHGFRLAAYNIQKTLEPGETVDVEFVADKKGTFGFACSVFCGNGHLAMVGKLVVQ